MKPEQIQKLVQPYSPWLGGSRDREAWEELVPHFRRPVFNSLVDDLVSIDQIVSVTGPRRVGKTTLLQQLVLHLLQKGVEPGRIVYYSFDDPALFRRQWSGGELLEAMMEGMGKAARRGRPAYLFVDEVQRLERWEQYLKKYYDLKFPVRVVVSGSASSPIFKKSRESLLGRVKDYHLLPFSFREFLLYRLRDDSSLQKELASIHEAGNAILGMFAGSPHYLDPRRAVVPDISDDLWQACERALRTYLLDGGFPEVWSLPSAEKKIEYLYDNQVKKVIYEDLVLATEFRKPEQLKTFYISLLERPGQEVNLTSLSREMGINVQQIDKQGGKGTQLFSQHSQFSMFDVRRSTFDVRCSTRYPILGTSVLSGGSRPPLPVRRSTFAAPLLPVPWPLCPDPRSPCRVPGSPFPVPPAALDSAPPTGYPIHETRSCSDMKAWRRP